jgi:segregation and condensation protein A
VSASGRVADPLRLPLELDLFEGPLDLLLTLVLREEIELAELPLRDLVEATLRGPDEWDPPTTGELVLLLCSLVELKARRLVGEDDEDDYAPDPDAELVRERLAAQLIAFAPFQRAGMWLSMQDGIDGAVRYRRVPLDRAAALQAPHAPNELSEAIIRLMVAPPMPSMGHMNRERINVGEIVAELRGALRRTGRVSFDELTDGTDRLAQGMTLMACLELARRGEANLAQPVPFGDITVHRVQPGFAGE